MANITLNSKTYTGNGVSNGVAWYIERSAGVASGFAPLTGSVRLAEGKTPSNSKWKLVIPVVAATDSEQAVAGSVLRTAIVDISVRTAANATSAELTDIADQIEDLTANASFKASIASLATPSG